MAASVNSKVEARPILHPKAQIQVVNAATIFSGSQVALCGIDHATAANRGRTKAFAGAAGEIPFGWKTLDQVLGNTSPGAGVAIPEAELDLSGRIYEALAVTGLTGDQTDVGRIVYMSDDNTFTLTRPTRGVPMGICVRSTSATTADVLMFAVETILGLCLNGAAKAYLPLGSKQWAAIANGDIVTNMVLPNHAKILSVFAVVDEAMVGAGGTVDINLNIDGTNVTGGVVTVSTAVGATRGTVIAGTAVTAANFYREGSLLRVIAANAGGTRTSGVFELYATVEYMPGL